ncbi:hypothetical protein PT974_07094 [Cladobotryum mycophilum]|uniref:Uncharacterized protein n=1 Tax=Cladobotryum mycophilum TaxID=491253 RepID=A0ABR0SNH8_9HYPO
MSSNPIPGLAISLQQASSSPPTITAIVTNKNSHPVTFAAYQSPFDSSIVQLGITSITPDGASAPIEYPTIMFGRMWPPPDQSIITIAPSASMKKDIVLKDPPVPLEELGKKATVVLQGRWMGVWAKAKEDVSKDDWAGNTDEESFSGEYTSDTLEITID